MLKLNSKMAESLTWQENKSLAECNEYMLKNQLATDVTFCVHNSKKKRVFKAHKYVLISRSAVFYKMFYGAISHSGNSIQVSDIEPAVFLQLLNYIYTDKCQMTDDNVMFLLYAAKKYMIFELKEICIAFLDMNIDAENVCMMLEQAVYFSEKPLINKCFEIITNKTVSALSSPAFLQINRKTLQIILVLHDINISEMDLFDYCIIWAKHWCEQASLEKIHSKLRRALGNCVYLIAFPTMSFEEFSTVSQYKILTDQEELSIYRYIGRKDKNVKPHGFIFHPRRWKGKTYY
jgi:hypothetical protein